MVDLPEVPRRLVTSQAPTMNADPGAGLVMLGRGVSQFGAALMDRAEQQKSATEAATAARLDGEIDRRKAEAMIQFRNDPVGFDNFMKSFGDELATRQDSPRLKAAVTRSAEGARSSGYGHLLLQNDQRMTRENTEALTSRAGDLSNQMTALAAAGKIGTPEYLEARQKVGAIYDQLVNNPALAFSREKADRDLANLDSRLKAHALTGEVERTYREKGFAEAEKLADTLRTDPTLNLNETERQHYYSASMAAIRQTETERRVAAREFEKEAGDILPAIRSGAATDDQVRDYLSRAAAAGATNSVSRVMMAWGVRTSTDAIMRLPGAQRARALITDAGSAAAPRVTAYSPQRNGDQMEGGYAASTAGPDGQAVVRTLDDFAAGRSGYVTVAGNPAFYGRRYTIPEITYRGADGQERTLKNVPAVVHDTGAAFKGAPEGRFDVAVSRDLPADATSKQPFLSRGVQFVSEGGAAVGSRPAAGQKMTADNWTLKFYKPEDMLAPTAGGRQVDARAATMADELGQKFFAATGVRVGINDLRKWGPGESTGGMRRGAADPADNPHVENSQHIHGAAFDFQIQGLSRDQKALFFKMAREVGFTGVGFYEGGAGHLHLDTGSARTWGAVPEWAQEGMAIRPAGGGQGSAAVSGGGAGGGAGDVRAAGASSQVSPEVTRQVINRTRQELPPLFEGLEKAVSHLQNPDKSEVDNLIAMVGLAGTDKDKERLANLMASAEAISMGTQMTADQRAASVAGWHQKIAEGATIQEQKIAETVTKALDDVNKGYRAKPYETGAMTGITPPSPVLNPVNPAEFKAGLDIRMREQAMIRTHEGLPAFSAFNGADRAAVDMALKAGDVRVTGSILSQVANLDPEVAGATLREMKDTIQGLARTTDPALYNATFQAVGIYASKPEVGVDGLAKTLGEDVARDYQTWRGRYQYMRPDEMKAALVQDRDPARGPIRAQIRKEALHEVTAASSKMKVDLPTVLGAFDDRWLSNPAAPMSENGYEGVPGERLLGDWRMIYAERRSDGMTHDQAIKDANERIKTRWGTTDVGGRWRIQEFPPEKQTAYKDLTAVEMKGRLETDLRAWFEVAHPEQSARVRGGPASQRAIDAEPANIKLDYVLFPTNKTGSDIAAGRAPAYHVGVILPDGRVDVMRNVDGTVRDYDWGAMAREKAGAAKSGFFDQHTLRATVKGEPAVKKKLFDPAERDRAIEAMQGGREGGPL